MAEKKYTIRIYDKKVQDRIDRLYEDLPTTFANMNALMVELLNRGLKSIECDVYRQKDPNDLSSLFEAIQQTSHNLDILVDIVKDRFKEVTVGNKVLEKLVSCNYSILSGINSGNKKDPEYIDKGFYDKLPSRFESIIEKLFKESK